MRNLPVYAFTALLVLSPMFTVGQEVKVEREYAITREAMPDMALTFLTSGSTRDIHMKYYLEESAADTSFEAKFKWQRRLWSVEFTGEGSLIDLEVITKFNKIPEMPRSGIRAYLDSAFVKYRFLRIQTQYSYPADANTSGEWDPEWNFTFLTGPGLPLMDVAYELEVEVLTQKDHTAFELLFDDLGNLVQKRRIADLDTDNFWVK